MKNVEMSVDGTTLTITVDLSKTFGPSASGKTIIIASTEGNVTIPNREEKVGLNVYRKNDLGWIHGLRDIRPQNTTIDVRQRQAAHVDGSREQHSGRNGRSNGSISPSSWQSCRRAFPSSSWLVSSWSLSFVSCPWPLSLSSTVWMSNIALRHHRRLHFIPQLPKK